MNFSKKILLFFEKFSQKSSSQNKPLSKIKLQALRGMKDQSPQDCAKYRMITQICADICQRFHYQEVQTPLLENISVFSKTLGTDILNKELYQFKDKSGQLQALRPEGTAGIVRFLNNENLYQNSPLRFFYSGSMFRYERPQRGRFRQFHQFGVELFGEKSPLAELELIQMAQMILKELKVLPKTSLIINSIGDIESRKVYKEKLVQYLKPIKNKLSPESQTRLSQNPLRILDSKSPQDREILKQAPRPLDFLNQNSKNFYQEVLALLRENQIEFKQSDFLVRGLDYYSHTVFEWVSSDLGAQDAVLAGGRYNDLVEMMGGKPCPAVGWACGIERMSMLSTLENDIKLPLLGIISVDENLNKIAYREAQTLREEGFSVYHPPLSSFSNQMKKINKQQCIYALIFGSEEWKQGQVCLKNMKTGEQIKISKNSLTDHLKKL